MFPGDPWCVSQGSNPKGNGQFDLYQTTAAFWYGRHIVHNHCHMLYIMHASWIFQDEVYKANIHRVHSIPIETSLFISPKINLLCLVHVIAFVYEMAATPTLYYVSFMTSFSMIPRNLDTWVPYPYKHRLSQAWDFRVKDKTVARPSYLWYGDLNTGKTTSLYWDDPLVIRIALTIDRNLTGNIDVEWPVRFQWPLLLTWINFNPSIDK